VSKKTALNMSKADRDAVDLDGQRLDVACSRLSLAAERRRLRVLTVLSQGERTAGELGEMFGADYTAMSAVLAPLKVSGFVDVRTDGRYKVYNLSELGWVVVKAADAMASI
jgi:DNA-binding transcriptional ArsR family regulator